MNLRPIGRERNPRMRFLPAAAIILTATVFAAVPPGLAASAGRNGASRDIFGLATSSSKQSHQQGAAQSKTNTVSPFGTPAQRKVSDRRWKAASKIADCLQNRAIPPNTNLTFSGKINSIVSDGRYTIVRLFESVEIRVENGSKADVPVTYTLVVDAETATGLSLKEGVKKSFTVDSNYAYMVWDDDGCTVRAVHNSLTDQDDTPAPAAKR